MAKRLPWRANGAARLLLLWAEMWCVLREASARGGIRREHVGDDQPVTF
ncbi:hypothetical protein [Pseudomonas putida]